MTRNKTLAGGAVEPTQINWPEQYQPEDATFNVKNSIDIDAPAEVVWQILINAERWPDWYVGANNVKISFDGQAREKTSSERSPLNERSVFSWDTMGFRFTSKVSEFEPPYRLSWESRKSSIQGYHAWLITPNGQGVRVLTEESQHGLLAILQRIFQPNKLRKLHDVWLAELKRLAEAAN